VRSYSLYLLDLDGTVYRGHEATPHAPEVLAQLRSAGAAVRFLTNNSAATPESVCSRLQRLGIDCRQNEVVTSGQVAAAYCKEANLQRLYVVGEPGLLKVLKAEGLEALNAWSGPEGDRLVEDSDGEPEAVIVGICRSFTYSWLNQAMQKILAGARFLATNRDAAYPVELGRLEPGSGAIVAALETCSGTIPIVLGKPHPYMAELAMRAVGVGPQDTLVVGDRMDTDIACGRAAGCAAHLVLCGVTPKSPESEDLLSCSQDLRGLLA